MKITYKTHIMAWLILCLVMFPFFPFKEWSYASLLLLGFVLLQLFFYAVLKKKWLAFCLSFAAALLTVYCINTALDGTVPYTTVIVIGLLNAYKAHKEGFFK
ncbi:hypothetical protein ACFQPF_17495 [Fictibacillus iocasae]|uniref:Uncharacterized protein n=1 Tax=Fictibacillus iocasae TaxID=2715437 RepID=A0ABW2NVY7_9BACL